MTELQCSALEYIYMYFNFKKSFRSTRSLMSSGRGGKTQTIFNNEKRFLEGIHRSSLCLYDGMRASQYSAIKFLAKVILAISTCHGEMDRIKF